MARELQNEQISAQQAAARELGKVLRRRVCETLLSDCLLNVNVLAIVVSHLNISTKLP